MGKQEKKEGQSPTKEALFIKEYEALCEKHQMTVASAPYFVRQEDGTFGIAIKIGIQALNNGK
jgi:hypothetical protein